MMSRRCVKDKRMARLKHERRNPLGEMIVQIGFAPVRIYIITSCAGIDFQSAWKNRVRAKYGDLISWSRLSS